MKISLYDGPRDALAHLFSEADDSQEQIDRYRDLGDVLVAVEGDLLIGQVQVVDTDQSDTFEVKSLAVLEYRRSQGIGAALLAAAAGHCRERGAKRLVLATAAASIPALQFYQRQGFRISHVIRDFYSAERGYRPMELNGIPLRDEVILDFNLGPVDG
jgi:ribosomal protein S18 acetylase RimI-like enzyme